MRRITIIGAVAASFAALICAAAFLRAGVAGANNEAARLRWAFVDPHVETRLSDVTGIDVLDAHGRRALTRRSPGSSASYSNPRWSPDGRVVAFARSGDGDGLYIVSALGGRPRLLVPGGAGDLVWSRDGRRLAFSRECDAPCDSGLYVVDRDGSHLQRLLPLSGPVSWSKDDASVVCLCGPLPNTLAIVRVDGSGIPRVLERGSVLGAPAWSPDGRLIAYGRNCDVTDPTGDVYCDVAVTTPSGSRRRTLVRHHPWRGPTDIAPVWATSHRLIVAEWGYAHRIESVDPATGARRVVLPDVGWAIEAGPRGTFAYVHGRRGSKGIELVVADRTGRVLDRHNMSGDISGDADLHLG
jgi:dipeptidyl aminopeptidase/acylaminoacyl peptidase